MWHIIKTTYIINYMYLKSGFLFILVTEGCMSFAFEWAIINYNLYWLWSLSLWFNMPNLSIYLSIYLSIFVKETWVFLIQEFWWHGTSKKAFHLISFSNTKLSLLKNLLTSLITFHPFIYLINPSLNHNVVWIKTLHSFLFYYY